MAKLIELPDGRVVEFPDSMTDAQIDAHLRTSFAAEQGTNQAQAGALGRSAGPNPQQTRPQLEQNLQTIDPRLAGGANNEELTPAALASGAVQTAAMLMPASRLVGAGVGGYEGYQRHGIPGAVGGAAVGAFAPEIASKAGAPLLRALLGSKGGAAASALRGLLGEAEAVAPAAAGTARGAMSTTATAASEAAPAVGKAVSRSVLPAAEAAVPSAAQKTVNTIMREFAKKSAPEAKVGERIWLKLGPDGMPLSVVTPGQAARLAQTAKTWVARTW